MIEIIEKKKQHENINDKDLFAAFVKVYLRLHYLRSTSLFKEEITKQFIMIALTDVYLEIIEREAQLHYLLSLCYKTVVRLNGKEFTIVSKESLRQFKPMDIFTIAVENIYSLMSDDGFLTYVADSTKKVYESPEELIKAAYKLCDDEDNFKKILLKVGLSDVH